jgi:hypothetical protein
MLASSRLKPGPLKKYRVHLVDWLDVTFVGPALAGKALGVTLQD